MLSLFCIATQSRGSHCHVLSQSILAAAYDWTAREPITSPSDYLEDCLHYLEATFTILHSIPVRM